MAYNDTVTDSLIVYGSKLGHEEFNEQLNSLAYIFNCIGQILGTMLVSILDKYF